MTRGSSLSSHEKSEAAEEIGVYNGGCCVMFECALFYSMLYVCVLSFAIMLRCMM